MKDLVITQRENMEENLVEAKNKTEESNNLKSAIIHSQLNIY